MKLTAFPWQVEIWELFARRWRAGTVPHAMLIGGAIGLGKRDLAWRLAASLLCRTERAHADACGRCPGCRQFTIGAHPDFFSVGLEPTRSVLRVEQIRELSSFMSLTSQYGGRKVALLEPAERLSISAANALLKTLEEPPGDAALLLVSDQPGRLPATVRSRCVRLNVRPPPRAEGVRWLRQNSSVHDPSLALAVARGRPIVARHWLEEGRLERRQALFQRFEGLLGQRSAPVQVAAEVGGDQLRESLELLASWARDMLRLALGGAAVELENPDLRDRLLRLAGECQPVWLLQRLDEADRGLQLCDTAAAPQLLVEDLLVGWSGCRGLG